MTCPNCGQTLSDLAFFCPKCGHQVQQKPAVPESPDLPPTQGPGWTAAMSTPGVADPQRSGRRLRAMGVGEIVDESFKLYRAHFKTFIVVLAYAVVPLNFIQSFLSRAAFDPGALDTNIRAGVFVNLAFTVIFFLFVFPFLTAAVTHVTADAYLGGKPQPAETARFAVRMIAPILFIGLLAGLATVGGFILFVIPGIIIFVRMNFATAVLVIEGRRGSAAIGRSWKLTKGSFWRVFGTLILASVIASIVGTVIQIPLTLAASAMGSTGWVLRAVAGSLATTITRPIVGIIAVLLYFDLRIRKEGFDLALMAQELGAHGEPGTA